jgi:virulence-associated protein VapD
MYKFIIKPHIYNPDLIYTNPNDPFTFDLIEDIPIKERFIFNDNDNYYCFKANEFKYFISTNGNWNPYTKRPINPKIVRNLNIYINYYDLNLKKENQWNSINQAYTDVSQILEKMGFYNNTEWFLKLTSKQIKNVIKLFKLISSECDYFSNLNEESIFYDFAKDTIKIFENGNENFLLCCNYMKCLGMYSSDFYNSLPDWLSDIQTPIIINNNNRNYELVYLINVIDG